MRILRNLISILVLFWAVNGLAQEVRFSLQLGAAIPMGEFSRNDVHPKDGGFAKTGFNFDMVAARTFKSNLVVGANLGYAVFAVDEKAIQEVIYSINPSEIQVKSQSYQNINLQARIGYDFILFDEAVKITPFLDVGLGVFNSASYLIVDEQGNTAIRKGNMAAGLQLSPGMNIRFPVNNFVDFKVYGVYQSVKYRVDETFEFTGGINETTSGVVNYQFSSVNTGIGFTIRF